MNNVKELMKETKKSRKKLVKYLKRTKLITEELIENVFKSRTVENIKIQNQLMKYNKDGFNKQLHDETLIQLIDILYSTLKSVHKNIRIQDDIRKLINNEKELEYDYRKILKYNK